MSYAELIVDLVEPEKENTMYLSPAKLNCSKFFAPNVFDKATIKNCSIEQINSGGLVGIFTSLKPLCKVNITVHQPIAVMIFYDTKQIEANLKLVGFENIKISDINVKDEESGQRIATKLIEAQKPKGIRKVDVELEVSKTSYKNTIPYKKDYNLDKYKDTKKTTYEISREYKSTGNNVNNEGKGNNKGYYSNRFKMARNSKEN